MNNECILTNTVQSYSFFLFLANILALFFGKGVKFTVFFTKWHKKTLSAVEKVF